jgi:hypothetical protein
MSGLIYSMQTYRTNNFYNLSTFITNSKHLHNVLDILHPVQQSFILKKNFYTHIL